MAQKLQLPINKSRVTAGFKTAIYQKQFGFAHYGMDLCSSDSSTQVISPGYGVVYACGADGWTDKQRYGNVVVLVFPDVQCNDGKVRDVACRMYHLASIAVKKGQVLSPGVVIGQYGATGQYVTGAHLHVEFDQDIIYPEYAPGYSANGRVIKAGTDTVLDPSTIWYIGAGQSLIKTAGLSESWYGDKDFLVPKMGSNENNSWLQAQYDDLNKSYDILQEKHDNLIASLEDLVQNTK